MKKTALFVLLLSACAAQEPYRSSVGELAPDQLIAECDFEASKSVAGIRSGLEAGFEKASLMDKCMFAKGYRR